MPQHTLLLRSEQTTLAMCYHYERRQFTMWYLDSFPEGRQESETLFLHRMKDTTYIKYSLRPRGKHVGIPLSIENVAADGGE